MMRKTILSLMILLGMYERVSPQKIEYAANFNSGLYRYTGENSSHQTGIYMTPQVSPFVYSSPGRKSGFSYEFSMQAQRVDRKKIIYGLHLAYQSFQSKTDVTAITPAIYSSSIFFAKGSSRLTSNFIAIHPFAGYRLLDRKLVIDLKTGPELGICTGRREKIDATITSSGQQIRNNHTVSTKRPDLRINLQVTVAYKRAGINAGYSWGLSNYYDKESIGQPQSYSRFLRLGLNYRIR